MNFWHTIAKPIIGLAPMDGVTDASFRWIAAKHGGPDITVTEFTNVDAAIHAPHTLIRDFTYSDRRADLRPHAGTILQSRPRRLRAGIRRP
jgi:tRNA-dihydrouridine synthase